MLHTPIAPRPLAGPSLQLALLVPVFMILFLCPMPGPYFTVHGRAVDLPGVEGVPLRVAEDGDTVITVQADGSVFIEGKWFSASEILPGIQERLARNQKSRFLLRCDRSLPFSSVRSLFLVLRSLGVTSVSLVTYEGPPPSLNVPHPVFRNFAT